MIHEINANAALPTTPVKLSAAGLGLMHVDGPPGFVLVLTLHAGDPVSYGAVDNDNERTNRTRTLKVGQSIAVKEATELWTTGQASYVSVGRHVDDGSKRGSELKARAA